MAEEKKGLFRTSRITDWQRQGTISYPAWTAFSADFPAIDDDFYEELEETLIMGDLGRADHDGDPGRAERKGKGAAYQGAGCSAGSS